MSRITKVGVLALQGSFFEHIQKLEQLGVQTKEVRTIEDAKDIDALIIPGGESTVLMKLLYSTGLDQRITELAKEGMPIYGTCAGMIVLSKDYLDLIDIEVERNAYGRQLESFEAKIKLELSAHSSPLTAVFIRAPKITTIGPNVKTLATHNESPVLAQQDNVLVGSFHPELTEGVQVYEHLLQLAALTTAN